MTQSPSADEQEFVAVIDHDEVRNIALKYDPLNRSGETGFHVTQGFRSTVNGPASAGACRIRWTQSCQQPPRQHRLDRQISLCRVV